MKVVAELLKPYTFEQRRDFIIEQNYVHGYKIKKLEDRLVALDYTDEEKEEQERERISHLKCTKRVLALMLQELGISYTQLKNLIATNEQAQLEWELCVELERSNPLLDVVGSQLGLSHDDIDRLFKYANGEISLEEFKGANNE